MAIRKSVVVKASWTTDGQRRQIAKREFLWLGILAVQFKCTELLTTHFVYSNNSLIISLYDHFPYLVVIFDNYCIFIQYQSISCVKAFEATRYSALGGNSIGYLAA